MINIKHRRSERTATVTFSLESAVPVSVIGDFNDWDPLKNPLQRRSNGLRSARVEVPAGAVVKFRYLADGGNFFDDPDTDHIEPNGLGQTHGVLVVQVPPVAR